MRIAGLETTVRPPAGSPGNSLEVRRVGAAHARLLWTPAADADHYVVRRSERADFGSPVVLGTPSAPVFEDEDALRNAKLYLYSVAAANGCGDETP